MLLWRRRRAPLKDEAASPNAPEVRPDGLRRSTQAQPAAETDVVARLLGPFELTVGGVVVRRWTSLKGRTVLAYLLMHGGEARRETLMELLWPGYRPQSARNNLNVAIYAVRRSVEAATGRGGLIVYRDGCYALDDRLTWWVDVEAFTAAVRTAEAAAGRGDGASATTAYLQAAGLYRGALLEDEVRAEWHLDDQRLAQERYLAANEALAEIYLDAGDVGEALNVGEQVLRADPCRESTHRLLMRCFATQQQRQLIARQFQRCVDALDREFGLGPAVETLRLYRDLTGAG